MSGQVRRRGRSEQARSAILAATFELVSEHGYAALSVERIAARAGVGKQTIYRWWSSKSDVLAECVFEGFVFDIDSYPVPDTGDIRVDLARWFEAFTLVFSSPSVGVLRALAAAAAENEAVRVALYDRVTRPVQDMLVSRLDSATAAGDLPSGFQSELISESVIGIALYRLLTHPGSSRLQMTDVVDLVVPRR